MAFRVLLIGDIVGRPGRRAVQQLMGELIETRRIDFVLANGENTAGGSGITPPIFDELRRLNVDIVTMGDHCYRKKESMPLYEKSDRLLRPANLPVEAVGRGWSLVESRDGTPVAAICLQGRTFLKPIDCPFKAADRALEEIGSSARIILVDMHAEATSDKVAMGWYLDGRVSLVAGTHTHVQTADEQVLPEGTAYITDLGMTGPFDGVLGRSRHRVVRALTSGMPEYFDVAGGDVRLCGAVAEIDPLSGKAAAIERLDLPCPSPEENGRNNEAG
jgi:metallophosphoesterase (TIGR00282 family)